MSAFEEVIRTARAAADPQRLADATPYARLSGVEMSLTGGEPLFCLGFRPGNIGNPLLPALHGGVVGAFMEHAAILHLLWTQETLRLPKVVDFSIDYLRPGRPRALFARCDVRRHGRRVVNVGISAWQGEEGAGRSIAHARTHLLLPDADPDK